jgi:signal transduction histidine kinase
MMGGGHSLQRLAVTGLLLVCLLLAMGLALTALFNYRAARRAAEDVLFSRAAETAASFAATARMTGFLGSDDRLQSMATEMATEDLSIAVVDREGRVLAGAGGGPRGPRPGGVVPMTFEIGRDLRLHGQFHRLNPEGRLEYFRPIRGPGGGAGWGRRLWMQKMLGSRDEDTGPGDVAREQDPASPRSRPPGAPGLRLLRVTVPRSLAEPLVGPARITLSLAAAVALLLLFVGFLMHRAAERARRAEGELHRRRALSALGEMAAVLAHEIRTPLASMKGNAQLIGETLVRDDRVESIVAEASRLERLVNGLLEYARPLKPRRVPCDPDAIAEQAAQIVAPRAAAAAVTLLTDPGGCGTCLRADADQILQVLVNLLQNAVDATASVEGSPEPVVVRARRRGGNVVFTVQDSGPGLPEVAVDLMFQPFFTTKRQGTGLGLSVARQMVEQHGGVLQLSQRPEVGAVATVTLPERGAAVLPEAGAGTHNG